MTNSRPRENEEEEREDEEPMGRETYTPQRSRANWQRSESVTRIPVGRRSPA